MKRLSPIVFVCLAMFITSSLFSQAKDEQLLKRAAKGKYGVSQEELVTMSKELLYPEAMQIFNDMSKKFLKKPITDPNPLSTKIGVDIKQMYWRDALELVLRSNSLWYNETADFLQIIIAGTSGAAGAAGQAASTISRVDSGQIYAKTREVQISCVFIEINQSKMKESGISFSIFRGRDMNIGVEFNGAGRVASEIFQITAAPVGKKVTVDISTALRIFEQEGMGEVISRPQVTVKAGGTGLIQIGSDISIKERDIAGNLMDKFVNTGVILKVSPRVFAYGPTEIIAVDFDLERSSPVSGGSNITIDKTTGKSSKLLLNGEEDYVAGLITSSELVKREGIPLLKDLPWWVLGLRYIFGYDSYSIQKKELLVLLKADLLPTIDERIEKMQVQRNVFDEKLLKNEEELKKYQLKKQ